MISRMGLGLVALVLGSTLAIAAPQATAELQMLDDALPGALINDPTAINWAVWGATATHKIVRDAKIPGGGAALQVTVRKASQTPSEIGTNVPLTAAIVRGQKLVVGLYVRLVDGGSGGKGRINVRIQQNAAPYPGFGDKTLEFGKEWQFIEVSMVADRNIAKADAIVSLQLSGVKQIVEIGQTIVVEGTTTLKSSQGTISVPAPILLPQLADKGKLINDPAKQGWNVTGIGVTQATVVAKGMPGGFATQYDITSPASNASDITVSVPIAEAIAEGDVLTVAFLARTLAANTPNGSGLVGVRVQKDLSPYQGFGENKLVIGSSWKLYQIRTQARLDIEQGKAVVSLQLAGARQKLEIGPAYVLNAGPPQ